jgi:hypothetical protein
MNTLRRDNIFYTIFKERDAVSLEEAFALGKRDPHSKEKNRQWIGGKLARWRKKGLVEAVYGTTAGSYGVLIGIKLTELGKALLEKTVDPNHQNDTIPPTADILEIVRQFKRAHPRWEITFEIRLKEQRVLVSSEVNN